MLASDQLLDDSYAMIYKRGLNQAIPNIIAELIMNGSKGHHISCSDFNRYW